MATNHYFQAGIPGGRSSEQLLVEDLIIECMKIYGFDIYYMPRQSVAEDDLFNEDPLNKFQFSYPIEMYMSDVNGFGGEGDLLTKFGVEIRDSATFVVARRRWDEEIARDGQVQLTDRPAEGDVLYFPLTESYFEIRRVELHDPFFQLGKLYVYVLECELMQYSSERFETGDTEIDDITGSLNALDYQLNLEDSGSLLLEYETSSSLILETYDIQVIDPAAQNDLFESEINVLDFTEINPFGDIR